MALAFKTINYRGGVASFEIPTFWKEEYEPKGGGTFYEDRPDSGTLRLNVLSFRINANGSPENSIQKKISEEPHELLECGLYFKHYIKEAMENEERLRLYRWDVLIPVPPSDLRIACFSYTIVAGQESDRGIEHELESINQIVRTARFSTSLGVTGDYIENPQVN